jgi:xylulokinase
LKGGNPLSSSDIVRNNYYIGIDLGTTHIKTAIFDEDGSLVEIYKASTPIEEDTIGQIYDPQAFYEVVSNQISILFGRYQSIYGISITGMAEAGLIVNKKSQTEVTKILPWFDPRTVELANQITKEDEINNFYTTGLHNSYKYGIYKYVWLLKHNEVAVKDSIWLSVCDYIVWKLTGQFVTDPSFAARTYGYDIVNRGWDIKRLKDYGLTEKNFPKVLSSGEKAGYLSDQALLQKANNASIRVCIGGHDHICAAYAVFNEEKERICNSIGTAETYLGLAKEFQRERSLYDSGFVYGPYLNGNDYFWMANIASSGQSVEWFRNKVQANAMDYTEMNEMLFSMSEGPTNIIYYPFLSGIGTPLFDPEVSGAFLGLRANHTGNDMMKAVLEGINYQGKWILSLLLHTDVPKLKDVICVGGATSSSPWMQLKADITGMPVAVPAIAEATLLGAVAIMINNNISTAKRQEFLYRNLQKNQIYKVNETWYRQYQEIYLNKYTFLMDAVLKQEKGKKE